MTTSEVFSPISCLKPIKTQKFQDNKSLLVMQRIWKKKNHRVSKVLAEIYQEFNTINMIHSLLIITVNCNLPQVESFHLFYRCNFRVSISKYRTSIHEKHMGELPH
ncbi:hypothetical protein DsansV1_C19g0157251 [Dioscorea sansibarensis]